MSADILIIGGGIVGCALAAFAAEGGAEVVLYEREAIAAGASGRNSGVVQDTLDPAFTDLYEESLEHYRTLGHGFELPAEPAGLLIVSDRPFEPVPNATYLEGAALREAEPALADGLVAYRIDTGRPVPPAAAAHAFAARAREAGARIEIGTAELRADGVLIDREPHDAGAIVVAAGPWSAELAGVPVEPLWGVVVEFELPDPPRHVLEEAGIDVLTSEGAIPDVLFSAVTARGISAIGSTFLADRPDADALAPRIVANATRFLPSLKSAKPRGLRACARPISADGRPYLGRLTDKVWVATGHGAWGITLGPASARLVADQLLGRPTEIPPELSAARIS
ncbi:MAG TPA: FAD-binding oxidoreductase [Solirubrobacter sp.]|nr:FAD-binding oxidoreductase [Solirubrobacter sp.]